MRGRYKILVYGCQMNIADAERMEGQLQGAGYERTEEMETADVILINTCCVRETAEDKVYGKIGEIKKIKEKNPKLIFGIAGCMAQKEGDNLMRRAPHIDFVLGTGKVQELSRIVAEIEAEHSPVVDVTLADKTIAENLPVARGGKFSAWVPIMYGCNNYCTYCIVPYVRGRERSRAPEEVVAEVRRAVAEGYTEVTLLGQNVNSYGKDHKQADFADLLRMVDEVEGIRRVRFMTSHPKDLSDDLIRVIKENQKICRHLHLPLQSGSTAILKKMNRGYTKESYLDLALKIRREIPEMSLTTDIIVGFPGESEEDFEDTLDVVRNVKYDSAFTFIYSKRSGTPAAKWENQVSDEVIKERFDRLLKEVQKDAANSTKKYEKETVDILVENLNDHMDGYVTGRMSNNMVVHIPGQKNLIGKIISVVLDEAKGFYYMGHMVESEV